MNIQTMREKETEDEDTRRKKLAMLLTADNMEDESQMDLALHGELAGKIVENIFEQVRKEREGEKKRKEARDMRASSLIDDRTD